MNFNHLSIKQGDNLPEFAITPSYMQLFMYSAITWNRHHVHYSKDAAIEEGLPDVVVHRGLLGNFLASMFESWLGDNGELQNLNWKVLSSATPKLELTCQAKATNVVSEEDAIIVSCDLEINQQDKRISVGDATVKLFLD